MEDWYWATRERPEMVWQPRPVHDDGMSILPLETGPVSSLETCALFFHQLIAAARSRLWVASPYFVPDEGLVNAL